MTLAGHLLSQWPVREPSIKELPELPLLDVQEALVSVRPEWERLSDNYQLSEHLVSVQNLLDLCKAPISSERALEIEESRQWYQVFNCADVRPSTQVLLRQPLRALPVANGNVLGDHVNGGIHKQRTVAKLTEIILEGKSSEVCPVGLLFLHSP